MITLQFLIWILLSSATEPPVHIAIGGIPLTFWENYSLVPAVLLMLFLLKAWQFVPVVHYFLFSETIPFRFYNNCYQLPLHFPCASDWISFWNAQAYKHGPFIFRQAAIGTNSLIIRVMVLLENLCLLNGIIFITDCHAAGPVLNAD